MSNIVFYDSTKHDQIVSCFVAQYFIRKKFGIGAITYKDVYNVSTGDLTTYIDAITNNTLASVFVLSGVAGTGATGTMSYDQLASLNAKMYTKSKGVTALTGTCGANVTNTSIVLTGTGASAVNNFYKGFYIVTAGTTAAARQITAYNGTTKVCTVNSTGTAVTTTSTFTIIHPSVYQYIKNNTSAAGLSYILAHIQDLGANALFVSGTCRTNTTTTSIVLASTEPTGTDKYKGLYILTTGTTPVMREITAYNGTTKVCTVADTGTAITTTENYKIITKQLYDHLTGQNGTPINTWRNCYSLMATSGNFAISVSPYLQCVCAINEGIYGVTMAGGSIADTEITIGSPTTDIVLQNVQLPGCYFTTTQLNAIDDLLNDMYLCILNATTGAGQIVQILDYDSGTRTATVESFDVAVTGATIKYRVLSSSDICFNDEATRLITNVITPDMTNSAQIRLVDSLIDMTDDQFNNFPTLNNMLYIGKEMFYTLTTGQALL